MNAVRFAAAAALVSAIVAPTSADEPIAKGAVLAVPDHFTAPASDTSGSPRGISGMACASPRPDGTRECVAVNDEEAFADVVVVDRDTLRMTGRTINLVTPDPANILGAATPAHCPVADVEAGFQKPDSEGVAKDGAFVYVAGSHSCSGRGKYRPASYLLSRMRLADGGGIAPASGAALEQTWRLADALLASEAGPAYGKRKDDGTNIEGIAVADGLLYAGLRTPAVDGKAPVVIAPLDALFAPGHEKLDPSTVRTARVALGDGSGVRDLAALSGDGLLILSGPTMIQTDIPYRLWIADRKHLDTPPKLLATIPPTPNAAGERPVGRGYGGDTPKAESVAVLEQTADTLTVLVMYDNVDEGWPTRFTVTLPR